MLMLSEIEDVYPELNPFYGEECIAECNNAIVLIGESHYLPAETKCNTDPDVWYAGGSILDETDRYWINTAGILKDEIPTGLTNRAHSIWKLSAMAINNAGPQYEGSTGDVLSKIYRRIIAFNFFMRPAKKGDSLKGQLDGRDIVIAKERVGRLFETIRPMGVVVLSSFVADNFDFSVLQRLEIPYACTPHPAHEWWNRRSNRSNHRTGPETIKYFVQKIGFA